MSRRKFTKIEELINSFIKSETDIKRISDGQRELVHRYFELWIRNRNIKSDTQIFIASTEAKKLARSKYKDIREVCVNLKGYSNASEGVCDLIVGWKYSFDELCFNMLKEMIKDTSKTPNIISDMPGADTENYTQTDRSNRWYHSLQNMDRKQKAIVFEGSADFDIVNCFPNLFNKFIIGDHMDYMALNGDLPPQDFIDMINQPELFLQKLINDNVQTFKMKGDKHTSDRSKAKQMRSRLFCAPLNKALRKTGCEWYDKLGEWIRSELMMAGVTDAHKYFTDLEQQVMRLAINIVGRDNVKLRMHDGFISKDISDREVMLEKLKFATGLNWSVKIIGEQHD